MEEIVKVNNGLPIPKDIDKIKEVLAEFEIYIPDEQSSYISITSLEKWEISFYNSYTNEECFAKYTDRRPGYDCYPYRLDSPESFLCQQFKTQDSLEIKWFELKGDKYIPTDLFGNDFKYVNPGDRKKELVIDKLFFSTQIDNEDYLLEIQKDFSKEVQRENLGITVYKGKIEDIYYFEENIPFNRKSNRKTKASVLREIIYKKDNDYNFYQADNKEYRYIYGKNMKRKSENRNLQDDRYVYGFSSRNDDGEYYGVLSEDGSQKFKNIQPIEWNFGLPTFLEELDMSNPVSKIYFRSNTSDKFIEYISVIKSNANITIYIFYKYFDLDEIDRDVIDLPIQTSGSITTDEIIHIINTLSGRIKDKGIMAFIKELNIFIERKQEREDINNMGSEISDLTNPNMAVNFDIDTIKDVIANMGVSDAIKNIIKSYDKKFEIDNTSISNGNKLSFQN